MWNRAALFLLLASVASLPAGGRELSPAHRLRKLSLHLRGVPPSADEYAELGAAKRASRLGEFFEERARRYLAAEQHVGKMVERIDKLFRLRTPMGLTETRLLQPQSDPMMVPGAETLNALDLLGAEMARENLPWDRLLIASDYLLYSTAGPFATDAQFLRVVAPELGLAPKGFLRFTPGPEDKRFAGALTTGRFFTRYGTTNLNRNRGRAAAIFRIFLCDDMRAVVEAKAEEEAELLEKAFPSPPEPDGYHRGLTDEDPHGKEESCRACHYKLDPMGRAFITSGALLSETPAPGALVYKRADGTLVDVRGGGIRDLAVALAAQPEYARCQVRHFWQWFVRADQLPSESRMEELVTRFEQLGRRTNDFIAYLVNEPEFRIDDAVDIPTLLDVKEVLGRCDGCHGGLTGETVPAFARFPIGGDGEQHRYWIERIVSQLDLANDGAGRVMPPKESAWQPTAEDVLRMKAWVSGGARDETGAPSIEPALGLELVGVTSPISLKTQPAFAGTFKRYLSGSDLFRVWHDRFPLVPFNQFSRCQSQQPADRATIGDPNPFDGELVFRAPGPGFVQWYGKCVLEWIDAELALAHVKDMRPFFGPDATAALEAAGLEGVISSPKGTEWTALPDAIRAKIVAHLVRAYIGPGILPDEGGYVERLLKLTSKALARASVFEALRKVLFLVTTEEAFLSY